MQRKQFEFQYHVPFSKTAAAFQHLLRNLNISHLLFKSINRDVFLKKETTDNYGKKIKNLKATQVLSSFINMCSSCWDYQYLSTTATECEAQLHGEENSVDRAGKYLLEILLGIITSSKHCLHKCY